MSSVAVVQPRSGGDHDLCGRDGLSDVSHGVVRDVDEESGNRGRQAFASDSSRIGVLVGREGTDSVGEVFQRFAKITEQLVARGVRLEFRLQISNLFCGDLETFSVATQKIAAAEDEANVKSNRRKFVRLGVELLVREL